MIKAIRLTVTNYYVSIISSSELTVKFFNALVVQNLTVLSSPAGVFEFYGTIFYLLS